MKNILFSIALFISTFLMAQTPQGMSYQAVAFDTSGNPIANGTIGVKISILDNSISGTNVYSETFTKPSNAQGLFNLNIGQGNVTLGNFSNLNWGANSKFIKVEIDPTGGTNYTITGTNQLMSVPYALYAENVNVAKLTKTIHSGSQINEKIVIYTDTDAYGFFQYDNGNSGWNSQSLNGTVLGAVASDNTIVVYTDTDAYGFFQYPSTGNAGWNSQSLNGTVIDAVASKNQIVIYTDTNAYGFFQYGNGNSSWNNRSINGLPINAVASTTNIVVYTDTDAYGFFQYPSTGNAGWNSQSLNGTAIGAVASKNTIVVYTNVNTYGFFQYDNGNSSWNSHSLNGTPINGISK